MKEELEQLLAQHMAERPASAYTEQLRENAARTQAELVFLGYKLCSGTDTKMITRAGQAIEMLHAVTVCLERDEDEAQARQALHQAEIILANLDTDAENKIKVLSITNRTYMLMARAKAFPNDPQVGYWRATECALNPLHVGMVLAGADCHATDAVTPAALAFGTTLLAEENQNISALELSLRKALSKLEVD